MSRPVRPGPVESTRSRRTADGGLATNSGPGRVLVAVYGVFALSATARAAVQIATKFEVAPLAYVASAVAGLVYVVATISLARGTRGSRRVALVAIVVELVGVLGVGTLTLVDPTAFPDATVWSDFGMGYGFVPLVLPFLGLLWLRRSRPRPSGA
ncbi:MAG: hypothetical protein ACR2LI_02465 [Propionibacteriaceae bacterium]